ncbi:hypothetical protein JKP88DRAFT_308385 [Tribonema minus]|uniref:Methyltransferase type 11 domain-containing protein n=1 Tax=Tribonema minus TaxID=303371 RepID=A0A835Z6K6_9STRA|nr:hypothetical protein JKP88DRAFT_308385 [Tribonema minus]
MEDGRRQSERLGLDSQGIDLCEGADAQGRPYRVDSPPRSFSRAYYPHLMAMYELAGVAVEPFDWGCWCRGGAVRLGGLAVVVKAVDFFCCVAVEPFDWGYSLSMAGAPRAYLCVRERRLFGWRLPCFPGQLWHAWRLPCFPGQLWRAFSPATARIVRDGLRYFRDVRRDAHDPDMCALSVGQYLAAKAYSSEYVDRVFLPLYRCDAHDPDMCALSVGQYLAAKANSSEYVDRVFLPLYSMILTCSFAAVLEYPMDIVMAYSLRAASDNQYHAAGELGATVTAVLHGGAGIGGGGASPRVLWRRRLRVTEGGGDSGSGSGADGWAGAGDGKYEGGNEDEAEEEEEFDHVVMATPAHSALGALPRASSEEAAALSAFAYEESEVVVHRDARGGGGGGALLPRDARDVNSINFVTHAGARRCTATLLLPDPSRPGAVVYQSWNPPPDAQLTEMIWRIRYSLFMPAGNAQPAETIRRIRYSRSVVTLRTRAAVAALHACQGRGGVWFVGAYALDQVPLQEQGVRSAVAVSIDSNLFGRRRTGAVWFVGAYALDQVPLQEQGVRSAVAEQGVRSVVAEQGVRSVVAVADALGVRAPWAAHFTAAAARAAAATAARGMTPLYNCGSGGSSSGSSGMSARALLNGHASRGGCACGVRPQCAEPVGRDTALRSEGRDGSAAAPRKYAGGKGEAPRCGGGGSAECAGHVADAAGRTLWMNWGLWRPLRSGAMPTYPQACELLGLLAGDAACEQLASLAGDAIALSSADRVVDACEQLASLAGDAVALSPADRILDVGCGAGDSLLTWRQRFGVRSVAAIEAVPSQRFAVRGGVMIEAVPSQAELARARLAAAADDDADAVAAAADVRQGCSTALPHADGAFTAVVSVDAVYHFASRGAFFAEANRVLKMLLLLVLLRLLLLRLLLLPRLWLLLPLLVLLLRLRLPLFCCGCGCHCNSSRDDYTHPGGRLAIIDLLLPSLAPSKRGMGLWCRGHGFLLSAAQSALRYACRIPAANARAGVDQVLGQLARAGFSGASATDITADTLFGFAAFTAARCSGCQCRSPSSSSSSKCSPDGGGDSASNGGGGARRRCCAGGAARRSWALRLRWLPYRLLGAALAWLARRGALRCALITARKPGAAAAALAA